MNETQTAAVHPLEEMGISREVVQAFDWMGFQNLTAIQQKCIPLMMDGHDIIAIAPTGTGKTLGFGIPMLEYVNLDDSNIQEVVLAPTRELAQQIADELGVELKIQDMAFDGIINSVMIGDVDIGIAAFTVTPERAEVIDFTHQYELSEQLLVVKKGDGATYATKESLAGKKVGAQMGTIQSELITSALPDSELFELDTYPNLAMEVINGNIVGFVCDKAVGEGMISQNDNLEAAEFAFSAEEAAFGKAAVIAKGNEDLVAVVNEVINKVIADGSYQKAYDEAVELAASLGL